MEQTYVYEVLFSANTMVIINMECLIGDKAYQKMGNKTSRQDSFSRSLSIRKSQKNTFQKIQKKLDKISGDIEKFNGNINDEKYSKIKQHVNEIINDLEKISSNVKDKHKDVYESILEKCNEQLNKLDAKVPTTSAMDENPPDVVASSSVIASPLDSPMSQRSGQVELKLVKFAVEEKDLKKKMKKKLEKLEDLPCTSRVEMPTVEKLQHDTVDRIDVMRKQIETLERDVHLYKQDNNDKNLYGYIRENLNQIIIKLDNMETYGNVQIKHERKLALQRAQECLQYLNSHYVKADASNETVTVEMHEDHAKKATYTRPITFDLNTNEDLKEELLQLLNKRMEEATKEQPNDGDGQEASGQEPKVKEKDSPKSLGESFENFNNSESEEEFDFVNVDTDDPKNAPILVTSL